MNVRVFKPSQRAFRAFLLSATALVAQPAWAADIQYTTAGPHTDALVIDGSANRIYAVNVVANFAGTVTFQNVAGGAMLEVGGGSSGTIIFAPTAINILAPNQRNILRISDGTTRIGNDTARSAIANDVLLQLVNGGTLDLNGSNLTIAKYQDGSASNTIINGAAATTATLVVNFKGDSSHILSTIIDGAGTLAVRFAGGNPATITGNNSYSGGTIVTADAQVIAGSSTALGTGIVRFEGAGGQLSLNNGVTLTNAINLAPNATANVFVGNGNVGRLNGAITAAGFADIFKTGSGELVIGGTADVSRIFLNQGALTSAAGANIADTASVNVSAGATFNVQGDEKVYEVIGTGRVDIANGASLTLGREPGGGSQYETTSTNLITGDGQLIKDNGNRQTIRNANNSYTGGTLLMGGTLVAAATNTLGTGEIEIGAADTILALGDGVRLDNAVYVDTGSLNVAVATGRATLTGSINGSGSANADDFYKYGTGTLVLTGGGSSFNDAFVTSGLLQVDGELTGQTLTVDNTAGLSGSGIIDSNVVIANGGTLYGRAGQTLSIQDNLTLNDTSTIDVELGAPSATALFDVGGALTLDGRLNITNAGGMGSGVYRLFDYAGALTDNTLDVNALPAGATATVQTSIANQVNILMAVAGGPVWQFWDGSNTVSNNAVDGGTGNWSNLTNWTSVNGSGNAAWAGGYAAFQGAAGSVTVAPGGVSVAGMQFVTDGYEINGGPITLSAASTVIRVGDGTSASEFTDATISSDITGVGALVKDDYGRLTLIGNNSYQGDTIIRNGVLIGDSNSIRNNVVNDSWLQFEQAQDGTFAGSITGSSENQVYKNGAGTLRLTGLNTLDWRINDGMISTTIEVFQGDVVVREGRAMRFEQNVSGTYAGVISAAVDIDGSDMLQIAAGHGNTITFTADSSNFYGGTNIETGALAVNGHLGGTISVLANGRLQGIGIVDDVVVSGTIAPGNSIGRLNIDNSITFNAGSVFEVEADAAGEADRIAAEGMATINGGTVRVLAGAGGYAPQTQYTILTAHGGIAAGGAFAGVTSNLAFLTPSLSYDPNNVYLTMTRNAVAFNNVGTTRNQIATGGGVESLGSGNALYGAVLNLSAEQARFAFDQLSGEIHASARAALIDDSRFIRQAMNDRLRTSLGGVGASSDGAIAYVDGQPVLAAADTNAPAIWGQGFGAWGRLEGDGNAARLDHSTGGFFVGADIPLADTWRLGAVAGYSGSGFTVPDRQAAGSSKNYHVGLFGGTNWGDVAFRTGAAYTWHDLSMTREVTVAGLGDSLSAGYMAGTAQVFGEVGYGLALGAARFEPFANLAHVSVRSGGFSETGGASALTGAPGALNTTFTTIGLRASTSFDLDGAVVTARGMIGWRHAFGDIVPSSAMHFAGGDVFSIGGAPIARDAAVVEAGLDYAFSPGAVLGVTYGGQFSAGMVDQSLKATFNVKF